MKPVCRINLIQEHVESPARRRAIHSAMLLYVLGCGVILAVVAYHGAEKVVDAWWRWREVQAVRREFDARYPREKDMDAYVRRLARDLEQARRNLLVVDDFYQKQRGVSQIVLGIALELPEMAELISFAADTKKGEVEFEVAVPQVPSGGRFSATEMATAWNGTPAIRQRLTPISSVASERRLVGSELCEVYRFVGGFKKTEE